MPSKSVEKHLKVIFKDDKLVEASQLFDRLLDRLALSEQVEQPSSETVYLITYGDSFYEQGKSSLETLHDVIQDKLPVVTDVHILPMFPYTSDDGFSVVDYTQINPTMGDWSDIHRLSQTKRLMFDFVCNHMSKSSEWFQKFLREEEGFESAFVEHDEEFDTSKTVRPRVSPLFHEYQAPTGKIKKVWTTFSEDQVDTNVQDPKMLARLTEVLISYIQNGATSIRLDAVGFMWKASGTTSMHLAETHEIIKLWRTIIDQYFPNVQLITETNVPHDENISYFGNGDDEANMVYQFPLPPLVLYTLLSGNATKLSEWANSIKPISETATYFNFLASHDGIGLRPTEGILSDQERQDIIENVVNNGGRLSMKNNPDGSQSVYEMNINYASALGSPEKMLAATAIQFSLVGIPAIYYHSIFGSQNDEDAVVESGINRRINRQKLEKNQLYSELEQDSFRKEIYSGMLKLIKKRGAESAFDPYGQQEVLSLGERVFAVKRTSGNHVVTSIVNVTNKTVEVPIEGLDILSGQYFAGHLSPYQYVWLKNESSSSD